jgi:hypothetical protein
MAKDAIAKAPSGRPQRLPVGFRNRLAVVDQDPNFVYRWVNANLDGGDRISIFEQAGYEKVPKSSSRIGNGRLSTPGPLGDFETMPGGDGDTLILMRIQRDWYDEDQKVKQVAVDEKEARQKRTPDGFYGEISTSNKKE